MVRFDLAEGDDAFETVVIPGSMFATFKDFGSRIRTLVEGDQDTRVYFTRPGSQIRIDLEGNRFSASVPREGQADVVVYSAAAPDVRRNFTLQWSENA